MCVIHFTSKSQEIEGTYYLVNDTTIHNAPRDVGSAYSSSIVSVPLGHSPSHAHAQTFEDVPKRMEYSHKVAYDTTPIASFSHSNYYLSPFRRLP